MKKNLITAFKVKVTVRVRMSMFVQMKSFKPPKHFVSKLGIGMHRHELDCHAKRLVCYFQGQGHSKGSYDQNMTITTVSYELLILLLVLIVHYHKPECLMVS